MVSLRTGSVIFCPWDAQGNPGRRLQEVASASVKFIVLPCHRQCQRIGATSWRERPKHALNLKISPLSSTSPPYCHVDSYDDHMAYNLATDNMSTADVESLPLTVHRGHPEGSPCAAVIVPLQPTPEYVMHPGRSTISLDVLTGVEGPESRCPIPTSCACLTAQVAPDSPQTPTALDIPPRRHGGNQNSTNRRHPETVCRPAQGRTGPPGQQSPRR